MSHTLHVPASLFPATSNAHFVGRPCRQWSTGNVRSLVDYTLKVTSLLSSHLGGVHAVIIIIIIIIIITYIYNALNDAPSAYRIHNKLKTILSKYIHK